MPANTLEKKISIDSFFQNLDEISGELDRVDKKTDQALQEVKSSSMKAFSNENYFESLLKSLTEQEEIVQKVSSENQQQNTTINNLTNVVNQEGDTVKQTIVNQNQITNQISEVGDRVKSLEKSGEKVVDQNQITNQISEVGDTVKQTIVNQNQITNQISEVGDRVKSLEKSGEKVVDQILNLKKENNTENQQLSKAFQILKQSYDSLSSGVQSVRTDVEGISEYLLKDQQQRRNLLEQRKLKKARETDVKEKSDIMSALKKALGSTKDQEMFGNIMSQQDYAAIKNPPGKQGGGSAGGGGLGGGDLAAAGVGVGAAALGTMMGSEGGGGGGQVDPNYTPPSGKTFTIGQLKELALSVGFNEKNASIAAAVAMGESGGNPSNKNFKRPDKSYGLWQINMIDDLGPARMKEFGLQREDQLFDPVTNAKAAFKISGGSNWNPWTVYTKGIYKSFLKEAQEHKKTGTTTEASTSSSSTSTTKPAAGTPQAAAGTPQAAAGTPQAAAGAAPSYLPDPSKSLGANLRNLTSSAGTPGTAQQSSMAPLGEPTKEIKVSSADLPSPKEMEISSAQPQMKQMDPSSIVPFDTQQVASGGYSQAPRNQGQQSNITSTPDFPEAIPTSNPLTKMWTLSAINHLNINGSMDHIYG